MNTAVVTRRVRVVALALAVAAALVVIAAALVVLSDARMASDDYALAARGRSEGVFDVVSAMYASWSGRWALFLVATGGLASVDPFAHYPWLLVGVWSVFALGLAALVRAALGDRASRGSVFVGATLLFALCFARLTPAGAAETFFWFTGGVPYLASVGLLFLVVGRLCSPHAKSRASIAVTTLAAALAAGLQEVVALVLVVALAALLVYAAVVRRERVGGAALVFAGAAASFAAVVFAPGNAKRAARESFGGQHVGETFMNVVDSCKELLGGALTSPLLLAGCAAAAFAASRAAPLARSTRIAVAAVGLALPLVALAAALHVTGGWIAPRMFASIALLFDVGLLAAVVAGIRGRTGLSRVSTLEPVALVLLAAALVLTGNGRLALAESADGRPARYAAGIEHMLDDARAAAGAGAEHLDLSPPPSRPRLFVHQGLSADTEHWANRRLAELVGLSSVRADW